MSFFGNSKSKTPAPVFNKFQKQGPLSLGRALDKNSSISLRNRQIIKKTLNGEFKGGRLIYNKTVLEVTRDALGKKIEKQVQEAFTPKTDQEAIRKRIKNNLKRNLSEEVRKTLNLKGQVVDRTSILGRTRENVRGGKKPDVEKSDLGVKLNQGKASITDTGKIGGFIGSPKE